MRRAEPSSATSTLRSSCTSSLICPRGSNEQSQSGTARTQKPFNRRPGKRATASGEWQHAQDIDRQHAANGLLCFNATASGDSWRRYTYWRTFLAAAAGSTLATEARTTSRTSRDMCSGTSSPISRDCSQKGEPHRQQRNEEAGDS